MKAQGRYARLQLNDTNFTLASTVAPSQLASLNGTTLASSYR